MRETKSLIGRATAWAILLGALALTTSPANEALAFDAEPHGWESFKWGTTLDSAFRQNKEWRKTLSLQKARKLLKTSDVVLDSRTEIVGRSAAVKWIFGQQGLHRVVLRWEATINDSPREYRAVLKAIEGQWGAATEGDDGEKIWEGKWTRAEARRVRTPNGSGVEIVLTARPGAMTDRPEAANPSQKGPAPSPAVKGSKKRTDTGKDDVLGF